MSEREGRAMSCTSQLTLAGTGDLRKEVMVSKYGGKVVWRRGKGTEAHGFVEGRKGRTGETGNPEDGC